jgi:hypothetical protein
MKHLVPSNVPPGSAIGSQEHDLWDVQFVWNNLMWNLLSLSQDVSLYLFSQKKELFVDMYAIIYLLV